MMTLLLGLIFFLGVHSFRLFAPIARERWMNRLGTNKYKVIYSVLSLIGFWLLVQGDRKSVV